MRIDRMPDEAIEVQATEEPPKSGAADPEAYREYLRGRYWWNKRSEDGYNKAIECFQQAIAKDPDYALAYCGLADCYSMHANYGFMAPKEGFSKANDALASAGPIFGSQVRKTSDLGSQSRKDPSPETTTSTKAPKRRDRSRGVLQEIVLRAAASFAILLGPRGTNTVLLETRC